MAAMQTTIDLLVGDDNQIYPTLVSEGEPIRTLIDSRTGTMRFASLGRGIDERVVAMREEIDGSEW